MPQRIYLLLAVAACISRLPPKPLPALDPEAPAEPVHLSADARVARLKALVIDLPTGYRFGDTSWGSNGRCNEKKAAFNTDGRSELDPKRYGEVFNEVMKQRGYPVEDQVELFAGSREKVAELQVGARIVETTLNMCVPEIFRDKLHVVGSAYLKIEWSVFSVLEKKVLLTLVTEGSTVNDVESRVGEQGVLRVAFAAALQRLASSEEYLKVVDAPRPHAEAAAAGRMRIKAAALFSGNLEKNFAAVREAVVTVTAATGSGSGFTISVDGKIVTAAHVVSGSKYAKVTTGTGKECYGQVAASNKQRDLAILQVDCGTLVAIPVSREKTAEGREVYAIGTPLDPKLALSVTKGVVSGVRKIDDLDYIQSDVRVLPGESGGPLLDAAGNAIGVTQGGISLKGVPVGVNFFVPLADLDKYLPVDWE